MGFFASPGEKEAYKDHYCRKCIHLAKGCTVLDLHERCAIYEVMDPDSMLHHLIPLGTGSRNMKCSMFWALKTDVDQDLSPTPLYPSGFGAGAAPGETGDDSSGENEL